MILLYALSAFGGKPTTWYSLTEALLWFPLSIIGLYFAWFHIKNGREEIASAIQKGLDENKIAYHKAASSYKIST